MFNSEHKFWLQSARLFHAAILVTVALQIGAVATAKEKRDDATSNEPEIRERLQKLEQRIDKLESEMGRMNSAVSAQARATTASQAQNGTYSPELIRSSTVEYFFNRLGRQSDSTYHPFAPMWALIEKAKTGSAADKDEILRRAALHLDANQTTDAVRWHAAYVLSGSQDPRAIPILAKVLAHDRSTTERGVAACALGAFGDPQAQAALEAAAATEKDASVQKWIQKALTGEMRKPPQ